MNSDLILSLLVIAALVATVLISNRRAKQDGQSNPVGTARLQADMTKMGSRMTTLEGNVTAIRRELDQAPTAEDFGRLEERLSGVAGHVESIDQGVVRIENILMTGAQAAAAAATKPPRRRS